MSAFIRDSLARKDDPKVLAAKVPQMTVEEARRDLFEKQMQQEYEVRVATKCIQPCLTNLESPMVSQEESDCLTNCTSKGMETFVWFKYLSLAQPTAMSQ